MQNIRIGIFICSFFFTLATKAQDTSAPVLTSLARDTSFECGQTTLIIDKLTSWYNLSGGAAATDNSGNVTFQASITLQQAITIFNNSLDVLCGNKQKVDVTFIAVDPSGNQSAPTTASFFTTDITGPVINTIPNVQYRCIAGIRDTLTKWIQNKGGYTASDLCSNSVQWTTFQYAISSGSVVLISGGGNIASGPYPAIPDSICNWVMNINFFVKDECGNQTITPGTTTFTVVDDVAPVFINPPADITVDCDKIPSPPIISAIDYCDRSVSPTLTTVSTQASDPEVCNHYNYTIIRTWTVSDACGNSSAFQQRVTVRDIAVPSVTAAPEVSVSCDIFRSKPDSIYISYMDNCSEVQVTFSDTVVSRGCVTMVTRTYRLSDACGNQTAYVQKLKILENAKPTIIAPAKNQEYACNGQDNLNALLGIWVQSMGGSSASPACGPVKSFAAVRGSYVAGDTSTYPGLLPVNLPAQSCPSTIAGFLRHIQVDFVYYDSCGNYAVTTGVFGVVDKESPEVSLCSVPLSYITDGDGCTSTVSIPVPTGSDNCTETESPVTKKIIAPVISSSPPGPESVVDPLLLNIGPFNPATANPVNNGQLVLKLNNLDIDDITEYFNIFDEDGNQIGITPLGSGQCSGIEFTLSMDQSKIRNWIQDGFISLNFVPNVIPGNPVLSINNLCSGSTIEASITFEIDILNTIRKSYTVNGGSVNYLSTEEKLMLDLSAGEHLVTFYLEDCAANKSECKVAVTVKDDTSPQINCPVGITSVLAKGQCTDTISLPVNFMVNENCRGSRVFEKTSPTSAEAAAIAFSFKESTGLYEAKNKQLVFNDVFPIKHLDLPVKLSIDFFGDNNMTGEYFDILGPGGFPIGTTALTQGTDCGLTTSMFEIPALLFNSWISTGQVTFVAVPKNGGDGINPCLPLTGNQSVDNVSYLRATLSYTDATFSLNCTGATTISTLPIPPGAVNFPLILNGGINKVTLQTKDGSGNTGSCTFTIEVKDNEAPIAKCKNTVLTLHPSGLEPLVLDPSEINAGSTDNCSIDLLTVVPSTFDCSQANSDVSVMLIATDIQGNKDTCTTSIRVKSFEIKPTFSAGLCTNDTLKLFANIPPATVAGTYSFHWDGPGNIEFFTENPFIPNADESFNGTYVLTVKGFNNCISVGSVIVNIKPLTNPVLTANDKEICEKEDLILSTTNYTGDIDYLWYEGISPNGILMKTTSTPELILDPSIGVHFYYVIAMGPDCSSNPSPLLKVTVLINPVAMVNDLLITPCEGDNIVLGSPLTNTNFTYLWTGPGGYNEQGKNPRVITNANINNAGDYLLIVRNGDCVSDTAVTKVAIFEKPVFPTIVSADIFCEGSIFTLIATGSPNAEKYLWYKNDVLFTTTQDNSLIFPNAQSALQGTWTVRAAKGNCNSDFSPGKFVAIDNNLQIGVINSGPVCAGDSVLLQATFVPNATYHWEGPVGSIPSVYNPTIAGVPGDYSVTVTTPTGCQNNANTTVMVTSVPEITALSNDSKPCMNPNEVIHFFPSVFPNSEMYTYKWSGPNNFTSGSKTLTISNISVKDTGVYSLIIYNKGCPSNELKTVVSFSLIPPMPVISATSQFYCSGDTIKISAPQSLPGSEYLWDTPLGLIKTSTNQIVLPDVAQGNAGKYTLQIKQNDCTSPFSNTLQIEVRPRPDSPTLASNSPVCYADTLDIAAANVQAGWSYSWQGPNNFSATSPSLLIPNVTSANSGTYKLTVSANGCISRNTPSIEIVVKDKILTPEFLLSSLAWCKSTTTGAEICLNQLSLQSNTEYFIINQADQSLVAPIFGGCIEITDISKLKDGTNFLVCKARRGECYSEESLPLVFNLSAPPSLTAKAVEDDIFSCPGEVVRLMSADGPPLVSVKWTAVMPENIISDVQSIAPLLSGLQPGQNIIYLDYSSVSCKDFSRDTVIVYLEFNPVATDDNYTLLYGQKGMFNILDNDKIPDRGKITIVNQPKNGKAEVKGNLIEYIPDPRFPDDQTITYRICADFCEDLCAEAKITITFDDDIICKAPNIITPNEDGINDYFVIPCLESGRFPENKVVIFNEWGTSVYEASPYNNDWGGTYGGNPLPAGTYFYILDTGLGQIPVNGFLIVQR